MKDIILDQYDFDETTSVTVFVSENADIHVAFSFFIPILHSSIPI
jgi:hypothetical protein